MMNEEDTSSKQLSPAQEERPPELERPTEAIEETDYDLPVRHTSFTPCWFKFTVPVSEQFSRYESSHFTTGRYTGYTMKVDIYSNFGKPEELNACVHMMPGQYDDTLDWPMQANVTLELYDPDRRCEPYSKNVIGQWNRVRGQYTGYSKAHSIEPFITHKDMDMYLRDGCLNFRIYGTKY